MQEFNFTKEEKEKGLNKIELKDDGYILAEYALCNGEECAFFGWWYPPEDDTGEVVRNAGINPDDKPFWAVLKFTPSALPEDVSASASFFLKNVVTAGPLYVVANGPKPHELKEVKNGQQRRIRGFRFQVC